MDRIFFSTLTISFNHQLLTAYCLIFVPNIPTMRRSYDFKRLIQYFLQGLLILAPVTITVYAFYVVFDKVDSILRPSINIPGLGFVIIILFVLLVGYLSSFFVMARILSVFNKMLEHTPGIKQVYSFVKEFFDAFAGNKKKFTKSVLANIDDKDVWRVGFITQDDMLKFEMADYVAVYVPLAYSVAGNVYIIPRSRIRPITNISAVQSMKFAVSGGVTDVVEVQH